MRLSRIFRAAFAVVLLIAGWKFLQQWYDSRHAIYYWGFIPCFLAAAVVVAPFFSLPQIRRFWPLFLLLTAVPYGEWFRLNYAGSREDWSRQLFDQLCFLGITFFLIALFRQSLIKPYERVLRGLDGLSSKAVPVRLIPFLFFSFCLWIALFVFHKTPLTQDTAAHLFQAKTFLSGHLAAPAPPVSRFFNYTGDMLVIHAQHWASMYQPGFAMLLAVLLPIHGEYWITPILGAFTLLIWINYCLRWHGRRVALIFGVLSVFSPFLFLMFATPMVHVPELFVASFILILCRMECESSSWLRQAGTGLLLAFAVLVRGFSIVPFLIPALAYTCWIQFRRKSFSFFLFTAAGLFIGVILLAFYQKEVYGDPRLAGYFLEYPRMRYGFGKTWMGQTHTPLRALEQLSNNVLGLNHWLNGWYSGALFFLVVSLLILPRLNDWDRVLLASCAALALFYFFHVAQDLVLGPRFFFLMAPILLLFVSRIFDPALDLSAASAIRLAVIAALVSFLPLQLAHFIWLYDPSGTQRFRLQEELKERTAAKMLVFLEPETDQALTGMNDPFLRGKFIIIRDIGKPDDVMAAFPGYQPRYFQLNVGYKGSGYHLLAERTKAPSPISLFQLALAVQGTSGDEDLFDNCYGTFLFPFDSQKQMDFLNSEAWKTANEPEYRRHFHMALIHLARFLILPKLALEQFGPEWRKGIDAAQLNAEFVQAEKEFSVSGDSGKSLLRPVAQVRSRIDRNNDGQFSKEELEKFFVEKIQILENY